MTGVGLGRAGDRRMVKGCTLVRGYRVKVPVGCFSVLIVFGAGVTVAHIGKDDIQLIRLFDCNQCLLIVQLRCFCLSCR